MRYFYDQPDMLFKDPATACLDVRHDLTGHVRLLELQSGGELFLSQPHTHPNPSQVGTDIISPALHGQRPFPSREADVTLRAGVMGLSSAANFWTGLKKSASRFNPSANRWQNSTVAPWIIAPALIETWLRLARGGTRCHSEPRDRSDSNRKHCSGGGGVRSTQTTKSKECLIAHLWQNCP